LYNIALREDSRFEAMRVSTIDAFQGEESGVVMFDLVKAEQGADKKHSLFCHHSFKIKNIKISRFSRFYINSKHY
jgi:hypothetical protein